MLLTVLKWIQTFLFFTLTGIATVACGATAVGEGDPVITGLTASDVQNSANAKVLVDGATGATLPQWVSSDVWKAANYPMVAQIDLGNIYDVSRISLFHGNGGGNGNAHLKVSYLPASGASEYVALEDHTDSVWNRYSNVNLPAAIKTRYLRLTISDLPTFYNVSEIQVAGKLSTTLVQTPTPTATPAGAIPPPKNQTCNFQPKSLPRPSQAPGIRDTSNPIQHIIVIMQENHSFDNYFGKLNQPQFYGSAIDGSNLTMSNPNSKNAPVFVYHESKACLNDVNHDWNAAHNDWNLGKNDGFVRTAGLSTMGYFDQTQIPFYYELANQFATADRYFCDVLGPTFPNRDFLYAATAFGHIANDYGATFTQKTIFDELDQYNISWKYYVGGGTAGYLKRFSSIYTNDKAKIKPIANFNVDLAAGALPEVVFMDSNPETGEDEHPAADIQNGQAWVASIVNALIKSSSWSTSALFFTYDENGGYFDHVAPPTACLPDNIKPVMIKTPTYTSVDADYDRYGFRVPFVLVSPYAKRHYVSHHTYSHSSIVKYIENKFNLPALTFRDANSDGMTDLFDYSHPNLTPPSLPAAPTPAASCAPGP